MCQAPTVWLNRKGGTMRGSRGCGRPLGAGDSRRDMPASSTQGPQPTLFFTPKASTGVGGEVSSVPRGTSCKSQEGHRQEESPEGGAVQ